MKALMMKIAKAKDENDFYKKFPSENAFFTKHGKAFEKALKDGGGITKKAQYGTELFPPKQLNYSIQRPPSINNTQSNSGFGFKGMEERYLENNTPQLGQSPNNPSGGFDVSSLISPAMGIGQGIQNIIAEGKKRRRAEQWADVSDVVLEASQSRPEQEERKYVRPEDYINTGEEFFPTFGVGTNVLAKQGKTLPKAQGGFEQILNSGGANMLTKGTDAIFQDNAGYQLGKNIGGMAKMIPGVGPVVSAIAEPVLGTIGGLLDPNQRKIKKANEHFQGNMDRLGMSNNFGGVQQQYSSFMEYGGDIPEYRDGGQTSDMSGDLNTFWGGYAEHMSSNPYLPDGGETVMFRGQSHDDSDGQGNTGIGMSYGNNPVEVEGGEPAVKLQNGGNESDLVIFGNLKIPSGMLDPSADGKKFKTYVSDLSKKEGKQNKILDKSMETLEELPVNTSFDKLKLSSMKANILGANMKLKDIAEKKQNAAFLQNAINTTAEENNFQADALSRGKIKTAQNGGSYGVLRDDANPPTINPANQFGLPPDTEVGLNTNQQSTLAPNYIDLIFKHFSDEKGFSPKDRQKAYDVMMGESVGDPNAAPVNNNPNLTNPKGKYWNSVDTGLFQINNVAHPKYYEKGDLKNPEYNIQSAAEIALEAKKRGKDPFSPWVSYNKSAKNTKPREEDVLQPIEPISPKSLPQVPLDTTSPLQFDPRTGNGEERKGGKFDTSILGAINSAIPYFRPSNAQSLDPRQLAGEMYAMSNNQLDPVYAQTVQPDLTVPHDISFQDMLNANQADYRSAERMVQNNPAALAQLSANKYRANQGVLGEQFRQNQGEKSRVYEQNRGIINQAKLQNLGILDQQQNRQSIAKSNTKAIAQKALESISNKYLQNQLENRTLKTYENLYNYRYDNKGRTINMNPAWKPSILQLKNGSMVKAIKGY